MRFLQRASVSSEGQETVGDLNNLRVHVDGEDVLLFRPTSEGTVEMRVLSSSEWEYLLARSGQRRSDTVAREAARQVFLDDTDDRAGHGLIAIPRVR